MKYLNVLFIFFFISLSLACNSKSQNVNNDMDGWFKAGSKPESYEIGPAMKQYNSKPVYYIKSIEKVEGRFGTIMKGISPGDYAGKRVRLSGYIKTENVDDYVGMWMRVDAYTPGLMFGFDNMGNRPINGTTDWQKYEIVLDVPDSSANIAYGILISGNGEVWLSGLSFEIVGNDVASTNMLTADQMKIPVTTNYSEPPPELSKIPNGIEVGHNPQTVLAEFNDKDTMYYWVYKTSVKPMNEDLEITEFGAYIWYLDHWEFSTVTGKPFETKDFAEWYKCKNGKMKKGKEYSDKNNWYRWSSLQKGKILWYYIGKNNKGELFKGTAMVDYLSELKKK